VRNAFTLGVTISVSRGTDGAKGLGIKSVGRVNMQVAKIGILIWIAWWSLSYLRGRGPVAGGSGALRLIVSRATRGSHEQKRREN
jgi:hypothetical protein